MCVSRDADAHIQIEHLCTRVWRAVSACLEVIDVNVTTGEKLRQFMHNARIIQSYDAHGIR